MNVFTVKPVKPLTFPPSLHSHPTSCFHSCRQLVTYPQVLGGERELCDSVHVDVALRAVARALEEHLLLAPPWLAVALTGTQETTVEICGRCKRSALGRDEGHCCTIPDIATVTAALGRHAGKHAAL